MKKILIALILFFSSAALFAQEETLFGSERIDLGLLLNHQLFIGAGGYGLVNDIKASQAAYDYYKPAYDLYLNMGYGGGIIEYTFMPNKLVHATAGVLVGGGAVTYRYNMWNDNWNWMDGTFGTSSKTDVFFVVEPSINIEVNMTTWMRMDLGGSYRFVTGVGSLVDLQNSNLRGGSANLTFKFGKF